MDLVDLLVITQAIMGISLALAGVRGARIANSHVMDRIENDRRASAIAAASIVSFPVGMGLIVTVPLASTFWMERIAS